MTSETIAAIATAPGKAGVAVVRVSGDEAFGIAAQVCGRPIAVGLQFVKLAIDACVVLGFRAPRSYTGEDVVEFQCHGGVVTPRRVLEAVLTAGARLARRGEFTERAFLNGKLDYDQAESVLNLIEAKTTRAADAALEGLKGRGRRALDDLYQRAVELSSQLEHALDVSEEELSDGFYRDAQCARDALLAAIRCEIRRAREGALLRTGVTVVLAGPPNAGKSSLLNALLEENRAIVSDIPGTTRDSIEAWLDLDGWPIRIVDTAGLRTTEEAVEAEGVRRAQELIAAADLVLRLTDIRAAVSQAGSPRELPVLTKCDLVPPSARSAGDALVVSAKTGEGLEELRRAILERLEQRLACGASFASENSDAVRAEQLDVLLACARLLSAESDDSNDLVLQANVIRAVAERLGAQTGATYSEDLLTRLFSRFCVGK